MKVQAYEIRGNGSIPALLARVPAGEPLMLSEELEAVDLNKLLTQGITSPMLLKVEGLSMMPEIPDNSWILVARGEAAEPGNIVVAELNGEITLKRIEVEDIKGMRRLQLVPSNGNVPRREIRSDDRLNILAVVKKIVMEC